jgi:hypothetical protein
MAFKTGQYIRHSKYGTGTIVELDDDRTVVDFDTVGVKKFVTSLATFEAAEGEAPKRKKRASTNRRPKAVAAKAMAAKAASA